MSPLLRLSILSISLGVCGVHCGGKQTKAEPPVTQETAAEEILRIASTWASTSPEQGLLSPPSAISVFKNSRTSTVTLTTTSAHEELTIEENVQLRSGETVQCKTAISHELGVRYGHRQGEAAVELVRPPLSASRVCGAGTHPEPSLDEPERRALFVLRADTLIAVEPPLEKRKYLPLPQ